MNHSDCLVRFAAMEWSSPTDGVREKVCKLGTQRIRMLEFRRGMEHPQWCTKGHAGYILEGRLTLEFDGDSVELSPGDGLIIPAGTACQHRPRPASERVLMVLVEAAES